MIPFIFYFERRPCEPLPEVINYLTFPKRKGIFMLMFYLCKNNSLIFFYINSSNNNINTIVNLNLFNGNHNINTNRCLYFLKGEVRLCGSYLIVISETFTWKVLLVLKVAHPCSRTASQFNKLFAILFMRLYSSFSKYYIK